MTKVALKEMCRSKGVMVSGNKPKLIQRLLPLLLLLEEDKEEDKERE